MQRFAGFSNYVAKFLANLPTICEPLRKLTCKDASWTWQSHQEAAFKKIKQLVTAALVLQFYDITKEVTMQCDARSSGLRVVLMHDGHRLAYTSKAQKTTAENTKQHSQRRKNLDETTKKSVQDTDTMQHQQRRKNLDETTKKSIQDEDTKQYHKTRTHFNKATKKSIQDKDTKQHHKRRKNLDGTTKKRIQDKDTKQHHERRKNLNETTKKVPWLKIQKKHQKRRKNTKMERQKAFEGVQEMSMLDPSILDTAAFCVIEDDLLKETTVGPEYC